MKDQLVDSMVSLIMDGLRQGKEQSRPNLMLHRVPGPVPIPQSIPIPGADQNEGADGIARYQHRQGRDGPASSLATQAGDLNQIYQDQIDEL